MPTTSARSQHPRHTLLVVDDDPTNRDLLGRRLEQHGFAVRLAADGPSALAVLATDTCDAVLLDVMMPGQSGLEVLTVIRRDPRTRDLPVLMVTAKSDSRDVVEALTLGANDYVTKPIDFPVALARVRAQLARATAQRAALALQRHDDLQHAQKLSALGTLTSGVAHDFNNLLTAITGYGAFLREELPPGDSRRTYVEGILKAAEAAGGLTRQLLALSRPQDPALARLDLGGIARNMSGLLHRVIGDGIALTVHAPDEAWTVLGDAGQFDQVLLNLVVNACDAMPEGGWLTVTLSNVAADVPGGDGRDWVELAVADTGCGIDAETAAHIFEPFFTTKGPGRGTGLGLAMVRTIVEQAGGTVTVTSAPGAGATFRVRVPRAPVGAATEAPLPVPPVPADASHSVHPA